MLLPELRLSERAARDTGLSDVFEILAQMCGSTFGHEALARDQFPTARDLLAARTEEALEAARAVARRVQPDFAVLRDVRPVVAAVQKGVVPAAQDILEVAKVVDGIGRLHDVMVLQEETSPRLCARGQSLSDERRFSRRVLRAFDAQANLVDDASPELAQLRAKVRQLRKEAGTQLETLVRDLDAQGYLRDRSFTVRNDRYVLPVKSEQQGRVEGIVHDASQTHRTVFIEPRALLQLGNRIKIAQSDVMQEEERILKEMAEEIAELGPTLLVDLAAAGEIDASFARGLFAHLTDGRALRIVTQARGEAVHLLNARHPLLAFMRADALRRPDAPRTGPVPGDVVGNDISVGDARVLVISGPNAGGKTVALKTVGLVVLLARAGVPVPVAEGSAVEAFACICSSIGDAQTLEGALSSFSGHLTQVRAILNDVSEARRHGPVLCLLDELLSGTDPAQGAALAQATLEHLVELDATVVATTHYERLKVMALLRPTDFRNASVALDSRTGRPTFRLVLDQAGTSNALDAARRFGLPEAVVARADALLSPDDKELQEVLRTLSAQKARLEERVHDAEAAHARLLADGKKLEEKLAAVEHEAARLRREGKAAFVDEIADARRTIAQAIEQAKGADPRVLNRVSHTLRELEEDTRRAATPPRSAEDGPVFSARAFKVGDVVSLSTLPGSRLTVAELDGDEAVLVRGAVRMRAPVANLREAGAAEKNKKKPLAPKHTAKGPSFEPRNKENSLDLRGERVDDAVAAVDAFLDRQLHAGRSTAYILHGHGGGALKKAVRAALEQSAIVAKLEAGAIDDGGDGWTVVSLKD